ncbi:MAG: hypothetical protein EXR70_14030 [Deltaproteobacteria bacterium]|nr:hypothetical protein [Deltaproteobacteria bacterium]
MTQTFQMARPYSRWHARAINLAGILLALAVCGCSTIDKDKASRELRDQVQAKIDAVLANGALSRAANRTTTFSENEVNAALAANLIEQIPKGIADAQVRLLGDARIALRAVVDVDEFKRKRSKPSGPLMFFGSKIPVLIRGELTAKDGQGTFKLQSAKANGIPLPRAMVLDLLANHTRSRNNPDGFNLEKPFELPASIRALAINAGEVIVVQ